MSRYKPLLIVSAIFALGVAFYVANVVFAEPVVTDCCAPEA